jgi:hypothetical protein
LGSKWADSAHLLEGLFAIPDSPTNLETCIFYCRANAITAAFRGLCREAPSLYSRIVQVITGGEEGHRLYPHILRSSTLLTRYKPCLRISQKGQMTNKAQPGSPTNFEEPRKGNIQRTSSASKRNSKAPSTRSEGHREPLCSKSSSEDVASHAQGYPLYVIHGTHNKAAGGCALACSARVVLHRTRLFRTIDQLETVC